MTIHHHLDDSTTLSYAAGAVSEAFSLVIAAHLELCPRCRARALDAEAVGGELLDELPAADLATGSFNKVWAQIEGGHGDTVPAVATECAPTPAGVPRVLAPYLPEGLDRIRWRGIVPGIRQHVLKDIKSEQGTARVLFIAPGTTIPLHTHEGSELTLVLKGSFVDEIGRFRAGDIADLDTSVHHQPIADTDQPCICLVATDARLRFSDIWSRMVQPLVGI